MDIIFDLDTSGSISETEWRNVLNFICNFMGSFRNPPNDVRFAAVRFATSASVVFDLDDSCNSDGDFSDCKAKIQALPLPTGETNLAESLEMINDNIIGEDGDRDDSRCPDLVIILTDGNWNRGGDPSGIAQTLHNNNVTVAAIGIGSGVNSDTLTDVASDPDFIFRPGNFVELLKYVDDLKELACDTIRKCISYVLMQHKHEQPVQGMQLYVGGT